MADFINEMTYLNCGPIVLNSQHLVILVLELLIGHKTIYTQ